MVKIWSGDFKKYSLKKIWYRKWSGGSKKYSFKKAVRKKHGMRAVRCTDCGKRCKRHTIAVLAHHWGATTLHRTRNVLTAIVAIVASNNYAQSASI